MYFLKNKTFVICEPAEKETRYKLSWTNPSQTICSLFPVLPPPAKHLIISDDT